MTQVLESELRAMYLTPYDWLPYFQPQIANLQPQVHQVAPYTVNYTCFWAAFTPDCGPDAYRDSVDVDIGSYRVWFVSYLFRGRTHR